MKRSAAALLSLLLALAVVLLGPPASAHAPYCGLRWGSTAERASSTTVGEVSDIRTGRHRCFDRLVVDVVGDASGYFVRYVPHVHHDGSGDIVPLRGGARLEVVVVSPAVATDAIFLPNGELADVSSYDTFRHVAWAGSFEGQTTVGLGVRARLPFRVFVLDRPGPMSHVVVDVAHRW